MYNINNYEDGFIYQLEKTAGLWDSAKSVFNHGWNMVTGRVPVRVPGTNIDSHTNPMYTVRNMYNNVTGPKVTDPNPGGYLQNGTMQKMPTAEELKNSQPAPEPAPQQQQPRVGVGVMSRPSRKTYKYAPNPGQEQRWAGDNIAKSQGFARPANDQSGTNNNGYNLPNNTQMGRRGINNAMVDQAKTRDDLRKMPNYNSKWKGNDGVVR